MLDGETVLAADSRGTRLGTGVQQTGRLDPAARERTLGVLAEYMGIVRFRAASIACIATSAMRRAVDAVAFARDVAAVVGVPPRILSGEEEATYSFLGATLAADTRARERVGVLDVGGGSTELAVDFPARARERGHVDFAMSVEIGAVRLTERRPDLAGAAALGRAARRRALAGARSEAGAVLVPFARAPVPERFIAVGGTAFTAAAMIAGPVPLDGVLMSAAQRAGLLDGLLARDLEARKAMPFIRPQRADILPAGIVILDEACRIVGVPDVRVSVDDLLAGFLRSAEYARSARPSVPGAEAST